MWVDGQHHNPELYAQERHPVPIGPQGRSRRVRKISPPAGFDPRPTQPVASRQTGYAILDYASLSTLDKGRSTFRVISRSHCLKFGSPVPSGQADYDCPLVQQQCCAN